MLNNYPPTPPTTNLAFNDLHAVASVNGWIVSGDGKSIQGKHLICVELNRTINPNLTTRAFKKTPAAFSRDKQRIQLLFTVKDVPPATADLPIGVRASRTGASILVPSNDGEFQWVPGRELWAQAPEPLPANAAELLTGTLAPIGNPADPGNSGFSGQTTAIASSSAVAEPQSSTPPETHMQGDMKPVIEDATTVPESPKTTDPEAMPSINQGVDTPSPAKPSSSPPLGLRGSSLLVEAHRHGWRVLCDGMPCEGTLDDWKNRVASARYSNRPVELVLADGLVCISLVHSLQCP